MAAALRHRGPDEQTVMLLDGAALGHARLAIIDLSGGRQPMRDEATGVTVVFNGEIFNYIELREQLKDRYDFKTVSDTEVIIAAYMLHGIDGVRDFVGQFAFAIFDPRDGALHLARDHTGIQPLYFAPLRGANHKNHDGARPDGGLAFASEVKALFAGGHVVPAFDEVGLAQIYTLWAPVEPRTAFAGVSSLPAGCVATFKDGALDVRRYWDLPMDLAPSTMIDDEAEAETRLRDILDDAIRLRLRSDVPLGAYLSGGLDSSIVCALAQRQLGGTLHTFSVSFAHKKFDEGSFQQQVASALHTTHHIAHVGDEEIGAILPRMVRHTEQPTLRSAPAPFLQLSRFVRDHGVKVVLTGEGSDEFLLGYDLYKETRVRRFWARQPNSTLRPKLLARLYPYLDLSKQGDSYLREVFGVGLSDPDQPAFSHLLRWNAGARISRFFSSSFLERTRAHDPVEAVVATMPDAVKRGTALQRAQWLEVHTLLAGYLISAQGDRMLMGNGVEGRFPFLDHRLIDLAQHIPEHRRLRGLDEKHVLKRLSRGLVPEAVLQRHKFPYRAPIAGALVGGAAAQWSAAVTSVEAVDALGVFDGHKVQKLKEKLERLVADPEARPSESDAMALTAIVTTQLLAREVLANPPVPDDAIAAVIALDAA
jgi:asparagine synthase (glutamine-hydrolysing)